MFRCAIKCGLNCKDPKHYSEIENFYKNIVSLILQASSEHIPRYKNRFSKEASKYNIPGWSEIVEPARQTSLLWHSIWKDNGSPREGVVANIRRQTRLKYHQAIKTAKKQEDSIRAEKMARNLLGSKTRSFWTEVKKVRSSSCSTPSQIDGAILENNISKLFSSKYKELYNVVSFDDEEMKSLISNVEEDVCNKCCNNLCGGIHSVSTNDIHRAIAKLKYDKQDGNSGFSTSHLIYGGEKLLVFIALLFSSMLIHGYTPKGMLLSVIIPIPKDTRKSLNKSDNYRGIALSSPLGKLMDWVFLLRQKEAFSSSDYQFGYKTNSSTTKCTFVVNEVISYFINNGSSVYSVLLDASKAFDRVHYIKLFQILRQRNLCPTVCRYLAFQYIFQKCCVKWVSTISDVFTVSNGVKQGGVISPILFNAYMDCLLHRLRVSGFGCYVGNTFSGAFSYADDLILLAPTRRSMGKLLQICKLYSIDYDICFNPSKSRVVPFGKPDCINAVFHMDGEPIKVVEMEKHLGYFIGVNSEAKQIQQTINQLYSNVNLLLAQFSKTPIDVKYKLFKSFCMSVYGSSLWNFGSKECEKFYVAWRKCIRRLFNLPPQTHCNLLNVICDDFPVDVQLHKRFIRFFQSCYKSGNTCIRMCSRLALQGSRSDVCDSLTHICFMYKIDRSSMPFFCDEIHDGCRPQDVLQRGALIHDLLLYNYDHNDNNVKILIDDLCVN